MTSPPSLIQLAEASRDERIAIAAWLRFRARMCMDARRWHTPLRNLWLRCTAGSFSAAAACVLAETHHAAGIIDETDRLKEAIRINREIDAAIATKRIASQEQGE